jgi:hypothetical protein
MHLSISNSGLLKEVQFFVCQDVKNDAHILCISNLYQKLTYFKFIKATMVSNFIGDKSYPLLPWLMILHKHGGFCYAILE